MVFNCVWGLCGREAIRGQKTKEETLQASVHISSEIVFYVQLIA